MKIVFMGTPDFAVKALEGLIESDHEVGMVVTQPDRARDRGKKIQLTPVKELALASNIEVLQPEKVRGNQEFFQALKEYGPDIIVVVAYGQIIPKEILELPRFGCINVHGSLLPRLRGASPIQQAIVRGEVVTGVTIMQMDEGLDTGDMLTKKSVEIGSMTFSQLHDTLAIMGKELLVETLELIEGGKIIREQQRDEEATHTTLIRKQDGKLDFSKSAVELERLIRGFDPQPATFCDYKGKPMKVFKAQVLVDEEDNNKKIGEILSVDNNGILVKCAKDRLLITEIQMPNKKRILVKDFIKGNSIEKGGILK